jgi:hypothetical protein
MLRAKTFLLTLVLATLAQAQGPHEFTVLGDEYDVAVMEVVRDEYKVGRSMQVAYHVATSDLADARITAVQLGADARDAIKINRLVYGAYGSLLSLEFHYTKVSFYAGEKLIATRRINDDEDPYAVKAMRIYESALAAHKRKAGR